MEGRETLSARDVAGIRRRLETSFVGRCLGAFVVMQGVDRAMAIAAQAFTALIPLLLLVSALAPTDSQDIVSDAIIRRFDLGGAAASAVRALFAHAPDTGTGVLSVVLLVFSGVSLTRRIQGMYLRAWRLEASGGLRTSANALLGLAALMVEIALLYLARSLLRGLPAGRAARAAGLSPGRSLSVDVGALVAPRPSSGLAAAPPRWSTGGTAQQHLRRSEHDLHAATDGVLQRQVWALRGHVGTRGVAAQHRVDRRRRDGGRRRVRPRARALGEPPPRANGCGVTRSQPS